MNKQSYLITEADAIMEFHYSAEWLRAQAEKGQIRCIKLHGERLYIRTQLSCTDPDKRNIETR